MMCDGGKPCSVLNIGSLAEPTQAPRKKRKNANSKEYFFAPGFSPLPQHKKFILRKKCQKGKKNKMAKRLPLAGNVKSNLVKRFNGCHKAFRGGSGGVAMHQMLKRIGGSLVRTFECM